MIGKFVNSIKTMSTALKYKVSSILIKEMKKDWDSRAERDAMHIIATWRDNWNEKDFFSSGEEDVKKFTSDFFAKSDFDPSNKKMLEIGCGIGRMTRTFSKIFQEVYAIDVSKVMIEKGKSLHQDWKNIFWKVGNGIDLEEYPDNFFDFCFSYIVFQHIPTEKAIFNYIKEMGRVLKKGGLFKFQVQNITKVRRLMVVNSDKIPFIKKKIIMTAQLHDTWGGAYVSEKKIKKVLQKSEMELIEITGQETQYMWVSGRKI